MGGRRALSETSWRRGAFVAFALITVVFGVLLNRAEDRTATVDQRVTKVESPCLRYGAKSKECREAFEQAVLTITHAQACAILRKAGLEIENCQGARLKQERGRDVERDANQPKRGDATSPNTGSSQPGPSPDGSPGGAQPGEGGSGAPPAPPSPGSSGEQPPPNSGPAPATASPPVSESATPTAPLNVAPTLEGVTETVCSVNALGVRICP
jgi:hypothetical protein